jgi:hypothetical protein
MRVLKLVKNIFEKIKIEAPLQGVDTEICITDEYLSLSYGRSFIQKKDIKNDSSDTSSRGARVSTRRRVRNRR